ncbi:16S rRNA (guanine(527)-N(7))-methyltransferase RsmG [Cryptosporangium aurantiacum]|uniref:Ribosomal RNA small subunit methyltransferase G n=1 Tax=Cryptosporangium aurantiacum TaxID=134849 RepID=A0A1M7RKJ5_9ACTN|nr:16S rRNA (guanine(527)-N(7))-methyltransferase RsmG [Cryptosporangium aurantiacum]SHN46833.1 16S rRNA m(7)G-527 methyltransferase [Cryptosporangium aurantiacum]
MSSTLPASPAGPPAGLAAVAAQVFGERLPLAIDYASLLATAGVERGLIGPREAPRLWDRHLLNCAVVAELFPADATVVDVGSGAGLPGLVLAIARPDLRVTLLEPLARRVAFLNEAVSALELSSVTVRRGRAEEVVGQVSAAIVTARAVAPLDRLAGWCLPLCEPSGKMLALKGSSAAEEITEHAAAVARVGGVSPRIVECGGGVVDPPTTVVEILRGGSVGPGPAAASRRDSSRRRPGSAAPSRRRRRGQHGP